MRINMCTNYKQMLDERALAQAMAAVWYAPDVPEVAGSIYPFIVRNANGRRVIDVMRWGFPPPPNSKAPVVNVRNLSSPFWRGTLANAAMRCLVPATSFSEWEGEKGHKMQRWFSIPSRPVFAFAGIWRPTDHGNVFAFLTCEPNPLVGAIHPKAMPVILDDEDYATWLDGAPAHTLAKPYPSQLMVVA
jgi:putative SOS response-associated peptidase YedK